jgi:transposase
MPLYTYKSPFPKRIRISEKKFRLLVRCFSFDCNATQTAKLASLNRNTVNRFFVFLRSLIINTALVERQSIQISNGVEIDESYFGAKRVRGKRGRGSSKKVIVLGLLKRSGRVYSEIIPNATQVQIEPIIRRTVKSGADIFTDGWKSYDALAIYGYNHKKVNHQKNEFSRGEIHINGVESFWSWTKRRLHKFNGIPRFLFGTYLLESEWRFNHRDKILTDIRKLVRNYPKT